MRKLGESINELMAALAAGVHVLSEKPLAEDAERGAAMVEAARAADRVLDFGPGPGAAGGRIVFDGTPDELRAADPGAGAKPIVRAHASAAGDLAIADEGSFADVDTEEEYQRLISGRPRAGEGN